MNKVVVKDLQVKYPDSEDYAIRHVSIEFELNKLYLIIGKSGSGKSTLGKVLAGIIPQIEKAEVDGKVNVLNYNPVKTDIHKLSRIITYLSQSPYDQVISGYVEDELSFILENVEDIDFERLNFIMKYLGIEDIRHRRIDELSGGQIQKLIIASILLLDPKVIVLDEPLAYLDPKSSRDIIELLVRLKGYEKCIILIEHRLKDLIYYFNKIDHVVLIDQGKIIDTFRGSEIHRKSKVLRELGLRIPINFEISILCKNELKEPNDTEPLEQVIRLLSLKGPKLEVERQDTTNVYLIEISNLWFSYSSSNFILKNINLKFNSNLVYAILGPNASGKSTLLLCIAGILRPKRGFVKIFDKLVRSLRSTAGIVGYIPQNPDLILMFESVEKEISERAKLWCKSKIELERYVIEISRTLGIRNYLDRNPHALSRGQRFRVALAATLALRPKILLLDETTAGQDEECISILGELVKDYVREDHTVAVVVTHDIDFTYNYTDKAIVLHDGKVYASGDTIDVLSRNDVIDKCNLIKPLTLELYNKYGIKPIPDRELMSKIRMLGICYEA